HSAEVAVSAAFGQSTRLRATTIPLPPTRLSPAENLAWRRLPAQGRRRSDWLLGRAALRLLMDGDDTSAVAFPHPHLSLSHAAGMAVAAGSVGHQAGLGVDFEGWRPTDPRTARFFLHDGERLDGDDRLRLWTVKEALFKATPANTGGRLLDYRLADPAASVGTALDVRGDIFLYASGYLDGSGPLAVAICAGRADAPV
ncbi:MAG: 4'-phosphopantetheinyl transferase superfamily protein, partial [Acidimicrobiales bacterium]